MPAPFPVTEIAQALTLEQCGRLIRLFGDGVTRSLVGVPGRRVESSARTSSSLKIAALPEDIDAALSALIPGVSKLPKSHQERWEIIRYRKGEKFGLHFDTDPSSPDPRIFTTLIYLQAPIAGGLTTFPAIKRSFVPSAGKLVAWPNYLDGKLVEATLHESEPVVEGEKWSLVTWIHAQPVVA